MQVVAVDMDRIPDKDVAWFLAYMAEIGFEYNGFLWPKVTFSRPRVVE